MNGWWFCQLQLPAILVARRVWKYFTKRVIFWLVTTAILSLLQTACLESGNDSAPADYSVKEQLPTITVLPTMTAPRLSLPPTREPESLGGPAVSLNLIVPENALVNVQYPAFVEAEIVGRGVASIARMAGLRDAGGRQRLFEYQPVAPGEANEERAEGWRDGVHELALVWTAEADVLSDSLSQEYVVHLPRGEENEPLAVSGSYQRVGGEIQAGVRLLIHPGMSAANLMQDVASGTTFAPQPGDEFRPDMLFLAEGGQIVTEPGEALVFDDGGQLAYGRQLLPAGGYFLGISATDLGGEPIIDTVDFIIEDVPLLPGYRAYLDPGAGFQFLYPAEWSAPAFVAGRLTSRQPSGTMELNITRLQNVGDRSADQLKREVIQGFGSIQLLFEDLIAVGGGGALWTAYGYNSDEGPHTGVFVVLVDNGTGYIIDVDGRAENEAQVLETIMVLTDSWTFRPAGSTNRLGSWVRETIGGLNVAVPADFDHAALGDGWQRFSARENDAFVAIRMEAGRDSELEQRHQLWLDVVGEGSDDFVASSPYEIEWGAQRWLRSDYAYTDLSGNIFEGSLAGKSSDDRLIFVWSEGPAGAFEALDHGVFDVVAADVRPED